MLETPPWKGSVYIGFGETPARGAAARGPCRTPVRLTAQTPSPAPESGASFAPIRAARRGRHPRRHELPGAVVLIGRGDEIVYQPAVRDSRAVRPSPEPMTEDTIFESGLG